MCVHAADAGAGIDAKDMNGDTPLTCASWHGRPGFILEKLSFGRMRIHPDAARASIIGHALS